MICRNCRTIIPDDSIFCENCGAPTGLVPEDLVDFSLSSDAEEQMEPIEPEPEEPIIEESVIEEPILEETEAAVWEEAPAEPEVTSWKDRPAEEYVAELDEVLDEFTWRAEPEAPVIPEEPVFQEEPLYEPGAEFVEEPVEPELVEEPAEFTWEEEPAYESEPEPELVEEPAEFLWEEEPAYESEPEPVDEPTEFVWEEEPAYESEPEIVEEPTEFAWEEAPAYEPAEEFVEEPVHEASVPVDPVWWQPPESEADRRLREKQAAADEAAAQAAEGSSERSMFHEPSEEEESAFHIDTEGLKQAATAAMTQAKPLFEKAGSLLKNLGKNVRTGTGWAVDKAKDQLHQMQEDREEKEAQQDQDAVEAAFEAEAPAETTPEMDAPAEELTEVDDALTSDEPATAAEEAVGTEAETGLAVETDLATESELTEEAGPAGEADGTETTEEEPQPSDEADADTETEGLASKIKLWKRTKEKREKREKPQEPQIEIEEKVDQYPGFWYGAEVPEEPVDGESTWESAEEFIPDRSIAESPVIPDVPETPMPVETSREVKLADTGVFHWHRTENAVTPEEMARKVAAAAAGFGKIERAETPETAESQEAAPEESAALENIDTAVEESAMAGASAEGAYAAEEIETGAPVTETEEPAAMDAPGFAEASEAPEEAEALGASEAPGAPGEDEVGEVLEKAPADPTVLDGYIGLPEGEEPVEPDEPDLYRIKDYSKTRERVTIKKSRKKLNETTFKKPRREMTRKDWTIIAVIAAVLILAGIIIGVQAHRIHEQKLADEAFAANIKQAHQLVQREKYKKAEVLYLQLIAERPEDVDPYLGLAQMYIEQQRYRDAKALIKRGIKTTGDREAFQAVKDDIKVLTSTVWKEEYVKVLEENEYDIKKYESRVQAPVAVCDVNGDMKPELFFFTMEYYGYGKLHIYTTVNDQAKEVEYDCKNRSTKYTDAFYDVSPNNCTYAILNSAETGEFAIYANNTYNGDSWDTTNTYKLNLNGGCRRLHVLQGDIDTTYSEAEKDDSKYILDGEDITYDRYLADFKSMLDNSREVILYNGTGGDQSVQTKVKPGNVMCMSYDSLMVDLTADE